MCDIANAEMWNLTFELKKEEYLLKGLPIQNKKNIKMTFAGKVIPLGKNAPN